MRMTGFSGSPQGEGPKGPLHQGMELGGTITGMLDFVRSFSRSDLRFGGGLGYFQRAVMALLVLGFQDRGVTAGEFRLAPPKPSLDRWVYPFNFQPGTRPVAPTYGSFDPRFDTRDAEFMLGWDTGSSVETLAGPKRYLIRSARVTLTSVAPVPPTKPFVYDPTYDSYTTYMTNPPLAAVDSDPGRPVELFGVGFRGGFTTETFKEDSAFGPLGPISGDTISIGTRNAYAAVVGREGTLIDIANHVGQRNPGWTNAPFEIAPWAVGSTTQALPGEEVPDGAKVTFALDLGDPLILGYVQRALDEGRLRLMVSSLSPAGQSTPGGTGAGGGGAYPWWATKENLLYDAPALEIDGTLVSAEDSDSDGLPDDWERFWLGGLGESGNDDSDADGSSHVGEWMAGTDPRSPASVLRIVSHSFLNGSVMIRFSLAASRSYRVERSRDLAVWEAMEGTTSYPERGVAEWVSAGDGSGTGGFFRVRVE